MLAALALGALAWALPRLAKSEAARAKIEASARAALGRELRYGEIGFGLLPPSLLVEEPEIAGEAAGDPPLARADRVALRVELWPLLRGQLEVASLAIDGLALHLVRTKEGLVLPGPRRTREPPPPPEPEHEPGAGRRRRPRVRDPQARGARRLARARGSQRRAREDLERRRRRPHRARATAAGEPIAIEGALADVKGGALEVDGPLSLEAELDRLGAGATGPFTIDARAARVAYGADFSKPAGTRRRAARPDRARARRARSRSRISSSSSPTSSRAARCAPRRSTELSLAADAFALDGWEALVPRARHGEADRADRDPEARALDRSARACAARSRSTSSSRLRPTWRRSRCAARSSCSAPTLRTRDLVARAAEQPIRVDASVTQLFDGAALRGRRSRRRTPTPTRCSPDTRSNPIGCSARST